MVWAIYDMVRESIIMWIGIVICVSFMVYICVIYLTKLIRMMMMRFSNKMSVGCLV